VGVEPTKPWVARPVGFEDTRQSSLKPDRESVAGPSKLMARVSCGTAYRILLPIWLDVLIFQMIVLNSTEDDAIGWS